jgi:uncharacterized protein (TIGR00369 family)
VSTARHGHIWEEEPRGGYPDPAMLALSGRERLTQWNRGAAPAPPLSRLTGAIYTGFGDGTANAAMPASGWLLNSAGVIGGGALAILADIAFGCSIETKLPAATPYTTAELSLSFLRPAHHGLTLSAGGQAIHVGRSVALSEAFVLEEDTDRLIAHGTSRCAVLPPIDPLPDPPANQPVVDPAPDRDTDPYRRPWPRDAILPQEVWDRLGGKEVLERQLRGELPPPPLHHLTGIGPVRIDDGAATVVLPATKWLTSPATTIQGGVLAMLADIAMTMAVQTTVPAGTAAAGLDLKVNYLRPALPDGRDLTARASIVHAGRTLVITRAEVDNADGKRVALATGSSMYLPGRPAALGELELAAEADEAQ